MSLIGLSPGPPVGLRVDARALLTGPAARRLLTAAEPLLPLAAEAAGLGTSGVLALTAGLKLTRHLLAGPREGEPHCAPAAAA